MDGKKKSNLPPGLSPRWTEPQRFSQTKVLGWLFVPINPGSSAVSHRRLRQPCVPDHPKCPNCSGLAFIVQSSEDNDLPGKRHSLPVRWPVHFTSGAKEVGRVPETNGLQSPWFQPITVLFKKLCYFWDPIYILKIHPFKVYNPVDVSIVTHFHNHHYYFQNILLPQRDPLPTNS